MGNVSRPAWTRLSLARVPLARHRRRSSTRSSTPPPTSSTRSASSACSSSCCSRAPASRSRARRSCCSPASTSPTGDMTLFGIVARGRRSATSSAPGSPTRSATTGGSSCSSEPLIHINRKHLEWADNWFQRHGDATVFFTRMLPIIRTFISLPAGVARMPFWRFTVLTLDRLHPVGPGAGAYRPARWAPTGRTGATTCITSTTWSWPRSSVGVDLSDPASAPHPEDGGDGRPSGRAAHAPGLTPARAAALGAVQGPTELLPVSSSAHLVAGPPVRRLGLGRDRPRGRARASRSRCTPAPRRRC